MTTPLPDDRSRLEPGTRIRNTYTIDRYLGSGRFADTYLVRHEYMGMQAMKIIACEKDSPSFQSGLQEAFLLSKISHPGIVRVFDANVIEEDLGGMFYVTMEFVPDGTLEDMLQSPGLNRGIVMEEALRIGGQITAAISHAHALPKPILHRDLKPSNILLEYGQQKRLQIRIADYGLAQELRNRSSLTGAAGTILYMSPESLMGFEVTASDVYSIGIILYQLLTGTLPFPKRALYEAKDEQALQQAVKEVQSKPIPLPSQFDPDITPDIDSMVLRALHSDWKKRFHSACELSSTIDACLHAARNRDLVNLNTHSRSKEIKAVFDSYASGCETLSQLADRLESLIKSAPELARTLLPHATLWRSEPPRN